MCEYLEEADDNCVDIWRRRMKNCVNIWMRRMNN
jgi:hypothetical protein